MESYRGDRTFANLHDQATILALREFHLEELLGKWFWEIDPSTNVVRIVDVEDFIVWSSSDRVENSMQDMLIKHVSGAEEIEICKLYIEVPRYTKKLLKLLCKFIQFPSTSEPIKMRLINYFENFFYAHLKKQRYPKIYATILGHKMLWLCKNRNLNIDGTNTIRQHNTASVLNCFKTMFNYLG